MTEYVRVGVRPPFVVEPVEPPAPSWRYYFVMYPRRSMGEVLDVGELFDAVEWDWPA